jgi:hypothetical protein
MPKAMRLPGLDKIKGQDSLKILEPLEDPSRSLRVKSINTPLQVQRSPALTPFPWLTPCCAGRAAAVSATTR